MKRARELWSHLGASDSIAGRIGRTLLYIVVAVLAYQCVTLRFDWKQATISIVELAFIFVMSLMHSRWTPFWDRPGSIGEPV